MPVGVLGQSDSLSPFVGFGPLLMSPMPVGVLGQSDGALMALSSVVASAVTNACRRFGSVGLRLQEALDFFKSESPMPVGVLGQSDYVKLEDIDAEFIEGHQCLSAFWVSRT